MAEARLGWTPWGARRFDGVPQRGTLLAEDHTVWEVVEVLGLDHDPEWPGARTHEIVLVSRTGPADRRRVTTSRYSAWWIYGKRFPVCSCCGQPAPCREQVVEDEAARVLGDMERFGRPDRCPACLEGVTPKQSSTTFPTNLRVPLGPPVTFHLGRPVCQTAAAVYEREWHQAGATGT